MKLTSAVNFINILRMRFFCMKARFCHQNFVQKMCFGLKFCTKIVCVKCWWNWNLVSILFLLILCQTWPLITNEKINSSTYVCYSQPQDLETFFPRLEIFWNFKIVQKNCHILNAKTPPSTTVTLRVKWLARPLPPPILTRIFIGP